MGSLTLTIKSVAANTSSAVPTTRAPAATYSSSGKPQPDPAPACTTTSRPSQTSSTTPSGCTDTRPSFSLISFGTPTTNPAITTPSLLRPTSSLCVSMSQADPPILISRCGDSKSETDCPSSQSQIDTAC